MSPSPAGPGLAPDPDWPTFSYAFQPIVDADRCVVHSYEALVRGTSGASAGSVFAQVPPAAAHAFDAYSRTRAVALAAQLGVRCRLNLNCLPRSVLASDAPIQSTLDAASAHGIDVAQIVIEVTEDEVIDDRARFAAAVNRFRAQGLTVAIDDFGAGYAGLSLLADFQPDAVKLDMLLVRGISRHGPRQAIVRAILQACNDLGIDFIAEGVETFDEYAWFRDQGVALFQGYLFAKPAFEELGGFVLPPSAASDAA